MKSLKIYLALFVAMTNYVSLLSQNWPVIIGDDIYTTNSSVIEDYDKGYLLCNWNYLNASYTNYGWLVKTDINGNIKWTKTFGDGEYAMYFSKAMRALDNGILISGSSGKYDNIYNHDPLFMTLDQCGNIEWCTVIHDETISWDNYGTGIIELADGSSIGMVQYYGNQVQGYRISLVKLDPYGEPLWIQHLAQDDSTVYNEEGYDLTLTMDSNYLVAGRRNGPQPYFIMCDMEGNEEWAMAWNDTDIAWGNIDEVIEKGSGIFYAIGGGISPGYPVNPILFKIDKNGNELYHKIILGDTINGGGAGTMEILDDTTLVVGYNWGTDPNPNNGFSGVATTDTLGNIIDRRLLVEQVLEPSNIIKTLDGKIVVTGHYFLDGNWDVYLWKMNSQLEDDSLYTQPMVYDSLCPDEIISDTIDLDCGLYVDINEIPTREEYENQLKIYPNPANKQIHLKVKPVQGKVVKIFNVRGRQITALTIPSIGDISVDVSSWQKGLYLFRLYEKGKLIQSEKVLIVR